MAKIAKKSRGSFVDEKYLGPEPDLSAPMPTMVELINAYNWYNYFYSNDDAKSFVLSYFKKHHKNDKELISGINNCPPFNLRNLGWSCRILDNGGNLPSNVNLEKTARAIILAGAGRYDIDISDESVGGVVPVEDRTREMETPSIVGEDGQTSQKVTIQDRIKNKSNDLIAELEDEIDKFINNGENKFKIADWLRQKDVKPQLALRIALFYKPLYSELFDAFEGKDDELKKAYARYKKPALRAYMEFVRDIISACEARAEIAKVIRKPRKKKQKSPQQLVSRLKFKDKDDTYNITSIKPTEIVGCNQLWLFNVKNKNLIVYNAMGPAGLNIKGSSLTGYDEKISVSKTLRKPNETLKNVLDGGKVTLRKLMDGLTTKPRPANGRINSEIILLRVIK